MSRASRIWIAPAVAACLLGGGVAVQADTLTSAHAAAVPSAHAAAAAPFGCRASVARVTLGSIVAEPTIANPNTYPCYDESAGVGTVEVANGTADAVNGGPAGAFTYSAGSQGGTVAPGVAAVANVQAINIPTADGTISLVGPAQADASYECVNDQVVSYGQSTADVVELNGQKQFLPTAGTQETIQLGGGAYMVVNEQIKTATSLTERVLDIHLSNSENIVVGEAEVTTDGAANPCAGTSGTPPVLEICPPGSTLDDAAQECVIVYKGTTIVVSRPFMGPSGGTVIALAEAKQKYKSPCLSGPGPKYVLVATKRGARVEGTPGPDRILARGAYERVAGLGGNDCIDGSGGNQKIYDGNGKDRDYSSTGYNRVAVGNGNDFVDGRDGRVWITVGNGNDTVYGGSGNSRIDAGIGHDKIYGGKAKNRIFAAGDNARVDCGTGKDNTAFVRERAEKYAAGHGCEHIHVLR